MPEAHYVILGNGAAANRAADVIREGDAEGRITLISNEFFPFYYRHRLSQYIVGEKTEADLVVRPPAYYKENRIRLRLGQQVDRIDFAERTLFLKHMEKVHYTKLLLCIGGRPRLPEVHHVHRRHFTVLKTLADARCLRERLPQIQRVLVLGGDLISVDLARMFLRCGKEVLFLIDRDGFWPLELSDDDRAAMAERLETQGIRVFGDDRLKNIDADSSGRIVVETRKTTIREIDVVGAFFGFVPDIEFLYGSGLDLERGILVDEQLRTNIPDVYAAGDCAQVYNPEIRNYWISVGWPNAEQLGGIAAHNILGETLKTDRPEAKTISFDGLQIRTPWWTSFES